MHTELIFHFLRVVPIRYQGSTSFFHTFRQTRNIFLRFSSTYICKYSIVRCNWCFKSWTLLLSFVEEKKSSNFVREKRSFVKFSWKSQITALTKKWRLRIKIFILRKNFSYNRLIPFHSFQCLLKDSLDFGHFPT